MVRRPSSSVCQTPRRKLSPSVGADWPGPILLPSWSAPAVYESMLVVLAESDAADVELALALLDIVMLIILLPLIEELLDPLSGGLPLEPELAISYPE